MLRNFSWVLIVAALVGPVRAAEIDKLLPADTEVVITVNVKQILGSALLKKAGLDQWKGALKELPQVGDILEELGFDPFTDLDRVTIASPGGSEQDRGLIIARGNFDT